MDFEQRELVRVECGSSQQLNCSSFDFSGGFEEETKWIDCDLEKDDLSYQKCEEIGVNKTICQVLSQEERNHNLEECKEIQKNLEKISFDNLPENLDQRREALEKIKEKMDKNAQIILKKMKETERDGEEEELIGQNLKRSIYSKEEKEIAKKLKTGGGQLGKDIQSTWNLKQLDLLINEMKAFYEKTSELYQKITSTAKEDSDSVQCSMESLKDKLNEFFSKKDSQNKKFSEFEENKGVDEQDFSDCRYSSDLQISDFKDSGKLQH